MTKAYEYAVTAVFWGKRVIISRHMTLKAAQKSLRLAKGHPDYRIETLRGLTAPYRSAKASWRNENDNGGIREVNREKANYQ